MEVSQVPFPGLDPLEFVSKRQTSGYKGARDNSSSSSSRLVLRGSESVPPREESPRVLDSE